MTVNAASAESRHAVRAADQVRDVLRSSGFQFMSCLTWHGLRRCAATTHAAVIVAFRLDDEIVRPERRATADHDFPCPLILVTSSDRENLRRLGAIRVIDVVFFDEVGRRLAHVLSSVALSEGRLRLRAAIRRREMHLTLKRALLRVVDLACPGAGAYGGSQQRFPRTINDLADLADVTAHYLRHIAADAGLPLGRILRRHAALRALEMRAAGADAAAVARCFGYSDAGGVRKLIHRNLGCGIDGLIKTGIEPHYARVGRLIEGAQPDPR